MSSIKSILLGAVLFFEIILLVSADNTGERRRFCGQHLTETLQFFCRHRYASPTMTEKRSDEIVDELYSNDEPLADSSPFSYESLPFLANFGSAAALRAPPRVRRDYWYLQRGVADECCRKPCTVQQLKRYCY
ncbi:hypothetical protein HA402_004607 [Bradysia odoriphaga]|nr:hypothetical protein HA402_004607 [Bradysia odoriphaga]